MREAAAADLSDCQRGAAEYTRHKSCLGLTTRLRPAIVFTSSASPFVYPDTAWVFLPIRRQPSGDAREHAEAENIYIEKGWKGGLVSQPASGARSQAPTVRRGFGGQTAGSLRIRLSGCPRVPQRNPRCILSWHGAWPAQLCNTPPVRQSCDGYYKWCGTDGGTNQSGMGRGIPGSACRLFERMGSIKCGSQVKMAVSEGKNLSRSLIEWVGGADLHF